MEVPPQVEFEVPVDMCDDYAEALAAMLPLLKLPKLQLTGCLDTLGLQGAQALVEALSAMEAPPEIDIGQHVATSTDTMVQSLAVLLPWTKTMIEAADVDASATAKSSAEALALVFIEMEAATKLHIKVIDNLTDDAADVLAVLLPWSKDEMIELKEFGD